jgi:sialic acid synthase SpsE
MAYAKGARTFERHIDIEYGDVKVSPYNSLPHQVDSWFKGYKKAKEMCGSSGSERRQLPVKEVTYLDALLRGVYAKRNLPAGYEIKQEHILEDFYLAVPLQKGQISCRELMNGETLSKPLPQDAALKIDMIEGPYGSNSEMQIMINNRGM